MRLPRFLCSETPAVEQPPVSPARALVEYRLTVPHTHADRDYRVGDIIEIDEATAERIRRFAGADALVAVHGNP